MTEEERIFAGLLFCPGNAELKQIKLKTHNLCTEYNATFEQETEKRNRIVSQIFAEIGMKIEPDKIDVVREEILQSKRKTQEKNNDSEKYQ